MPIFMDRHDIPGLTAMDVAEGHKQDLKIQHKYNCRVLTYWFDEQRGMAFCLIEAPQKEDVEKLHGDSHGLIPNQIIEVESNVVESFLGRIEDQKPSNDSDLHIFEDPALRTILVTELRDAALVQAKLGGKRGFEFLKTHNDFTRKAIEQYDGREVEYDGDGLMASFASVSNSVKCALEIQKRFREHNKEISGVKMHVAIGLSAGDPVTERDEFFGETIQFAKWLAYISRRGQILMSSAVMNYFKMESLEILPEEGSVRTLNPTEEQFLDRLMDVIEKSWNQEGFHVSDLCKQMASSKSQLNRKIISLTGHSPNEFIKEFRLERALKLIEKHQGNISEIAFESGFSGPSYFTQCFHKKFGILPSEYEASIS